MATLLEVSGLNVQLPVNGQLRPILRDVSFSIGAGESLGIVGESGSGKSMTVRAIDRLLPRGAEVTGTIAFDGADVVALSKQDLKDYRAKVAMIFQDPRAHINPVRTIGDFVTEAVVTNNIMSRRDAQRRAIDLLSEVGVDRPTVRMKQYPNELSGGLLQRTMIAAALLTRPRLLLADEPTTALDVTTQAEVMAIISELRAELGMAMIFITHDLDLAAAVCDRTAVMYAGNIVEVNSSTDLHSSPLHPYTVALGEARPSMSARATRLTVIPGSSTSALEAPEIGCAFAPRCAHERPECTATIPPLRHFAQGETRCARAEEIGLGQEAVHA